MSTMSSRRAYQASSKGEIASGVELFATLMLALVAMIQILNGIAAITRDSLFLTGYDYVFAFDLTTWGWVTLVIGAVAAVTVVGLLMRTTWGRMAGAAVAFLGALASFGFMPYYRWWGVVVLAFNSLVVWALLTQTYYLGD